MKFMFEILTSISLIAIAVWEWRQLARYPNDRPLRILVPGVTCLALVVTLGISVYPLEVVDEVLEVVHFSNFAWAFMVYCFAAFFLLAGSDGTARSRRRRERQAVWEFGVFALLLTTMLVVSKTAPPGTWHTPRIPADYRTWQNIVFYLCADGYALAIWLVGTWRAARFLRTVVHPWARIAILTVTIGASAMVIGVNAVSLARQTLYIIYPGSKWPVLADVYNIGRLGGQIVLALGLALPPLAALIPRARDQYDQILRRRYELRLAPLWGRLMDEFPHLMLPTTADTNKAGPGRGKFERMTVEITDGLAHLAMYIPARSDVTDAVDATRDPRVAAEKVVAALNTLDNNRRARWAGQSVEPGEPPYPQIEPDFGADWQGRARWMLRVGREVATLGGITSRAGERDDVTAGP